MVAYCTIDDLKQIVPKTIVFGTNILKDGANITEAKAQYMIEEMAMQIDSYLTSFYRTPLVKYKEADFSKDPVTFIEKYPSPIILMNARLTVANIFDTIFMAQQEPNVSEWGKNNRALAMDDLQKIQSGSIQLKGQEFLGMRFVSIALLDPARMPSKDALQLPQRQPGQ